jgi:HlyD family secretion protein
MEKVVLAQTSGIVEKLYVLEGESVGAGAVIASLSNDSLEESMRDSDLSLREAELSYAGVERQTEDYSITAPIEGSVISKTVKAGDALESGTKTVMAVIADMSLMRFTINVDELDIAKIQKGQQANITVDALPERRFSGTVDTVGLLGTSSNGVANYPVVIVFDDATGLWPGMNATADIVVDSAEDVLMLPVAAVNRGNTVLVKGAAGDEGIDQSDAPDQARYVRVELGLNNENFIAAENGLREGDIVLVPVAAEGSLPQNTMMMGPGIMPGGTVIRTGPGGAGGGPSGQGGAGGGPGSQGQGGAGGAGAGRSTGGN